MGSKSQIIPGAIYAHIDLRDKRGQAKCRKMWSRWQRRGDCLKGSAKDRWAWIKNVRAV